jgi:nicotinamide-nucleotide amidase
LSIGINLASVVVMDLYNTAVIEKIKDRLLARHETIAVAESVTSGHVQAALSLADNASDFYQGGITAYNLGQKCRHLHIEPIQALSCNCVSQKIATEMAKQVAGLFVSDWSIAITGYAAPVPELSIKKLFAYYAICHRNKLTEGRIIHIAAPLKPLDAQLYYTEKILKRLVAVIPR